MVLERVGVIGDIHAEDVRLASALTLLEHRNVELVVATGDIADGRGSVDACCDLLRTHGVVTVAGNHDRWLLAGAARNLPQATALATVSEESRAFLGQLPRTVELATTAGSALLCHGLGPNDLAKVNPDDASHIIDANADLQGLLTDGAYRWLINGHSHRRMVRTVSGLTIINGGTLKREHSPCFLEIDFTRRLVSVFEFATDGTIAATPASIALPPSDTTR